MHFDWRAISGPALTTMAALIAIIVDRNFVAVPNPAPLFVCIIAFAGSLSGLASGAASAGIAIVASALIFLHHRGGVGYDPADLARGEVARLRAQANARIGELLERDDIERLTEAKRARNAAFDRAIREALPSATSDQIATHLMLLADGWY